MFPVIGACSWSLQATSVPDLVALMKSVGATATHLGLGDPHHGKWAEGDDLVKALAASSLDITATMVAFPGEDYSSPATIRKTGGLGPAAEFPARLEIFKRAVEQTRDLGVEILSLHAGFIPPSGDPERGSFLDRLGEAVEQAESQEVIVALETGQESAEVLRRTLDEMAMDNLRVNFDPGNVVLYGSGDPIQALKILGRDIAHVHVKDARPPSEPEQWGAEVPLGEGVVGMVAFLDALVAAEYVGPLIVEREVGTQEERVADVRNGMQLLRRLMTQA